MTVDETNLIVIERSLKALISSYEEKQKKAIMVLSGFSKISLKDGNLPTDADTGQVITQARRDEVYDKCISVANELLGIVEE